MRRDVGLIVMMIGLAAGIGELVAQDAPAETGSFTTTFTLRVPESARESLQTLLKHEGPAGVRDYDLADFTFNVRVPAKPQPDGRYGLFVWLGSGHLPPVWHEALDDYRMICVAPEYSGEADEWTQMGLAVDAVANLARRYELNRRHIFIGGHSFTDSEAAIRLGLGMPDVFRGVLATDVPYCKEIRWRDNGHRFKVGASFPPPEQFHDARRKVRLAFVLNRESGIYRLLKSKVRHGFRGDGFRSLIIDDEDGLATTRTLLRAFEFFVDR